jgi:prepilin-type N-terminal cleavage/methylation domain-containing protein
MAKNVVCAADGKEMSMKNLPSNFNRGNSRGFSLLELMIVVGIIFILAALSVPRMMSQVNAIRLRYSATDLSGLLQRARMEAVRKNRYYSLQNVAGTPQMEQVIDENSAVVTSIPPAQMGQNVTVLFGSGSGAPGEAAFITSLGFTSIASSAAVPSFNARGLPCVPAAQTCYPLAGQGFAFFLSNTIATGTVGWAAVTVTPSGRCKVWTYDGATWVQQ